VLAGWRLPEADVSAVYPTRQNLSARTRACVDFLADWFRKHTLPSWP
jgi:DNA-binding transcriptional LysR family regulator